MYIKVGQEHFTKNPDGSFTQQETTFHDLVMFNRSAEKAAALFAKGDKFIAEGEVKGYTVRDEDGVEAQREEFHAKKMGHDLSVTRYTVDRSPRIQHGPTTPAAAPFQPNQPQPVSPAVALNM